MKKAIKILLWAVGLVVVFVLALVLTLPLWLGPVVKPVASSVVPTLTKTSFALSHLSLNPYSGRFELGGFKLGNPTGYSQPVAVSLDSLVVDVAMGTLCDEFVHVEEVTVKGLYASYVHGGEHGVDNFKQIQYNLAGGKDKYEAKQAESEKASAEAETETVEEEIEEDVAKKKFVIDRLSISDISICLGPVTMPIPVAVTLTDLGKKENGVTLSELASQIWEAILQQAGQLGEGAKLLGSMIGEQAGKLGEAVNAAEAAKAVSAGTEKLGDAAKSIGDGAAKAVSAGTETLGDAAKSIGDGAGKAVESLKGLFK